MYCIFINFLFVNVFTCMFTSNSWQLYSYDIHFPPHTVHAEQS